MILQPSVFKDERGYFMESFNANDFQNKTGLSINFVQDNESMSSYGVIRGLHAQSGKHAQSKLVRVVQGKVLDVVVDARKNSKTFGNIVSVILDAEQKNQLFVPKGCLHGFSVLEDNSIFSYKCDSFYNKESEIGVNPLDADLNIDWKINKGSEIISAKDKEAVSWSDFFNLLYREQVK